MIPWEPIGCIVLGIGLVWWAKQDKGEPPFAWLTTLERVVGIFGMILYLAGSIGLILS